MPHENKPATAATTSKQIAEGAFGLLIIASGIWLLGYAAFYYFQGLSIDWWLAIRPILFVLSIQFLFVWVGSVIRKSVAEGLVLGLTQMAIMEELREKRLNNEKLN